MIEAKNLTKVYGPRAAISDLTFKVNKGEIVGFLGPNGAGKSTTMKILTGFMPATSGEARIDGHNVDEEDVDYKKHIGYLPEIPPLYKDSIVWEYLQYTGLLNKVPKAKIKKNVATVIEQVGLGDVRNRLIGNLSKGFQQRVGLAQALVHDPKVLILDEPTVGLDPKQIIEIRNLIKSLGGKHTIILSSHILPEVTATCNRIIIINKGKIVAQDTISELKNRIRKGSQFLLRVRNANGDGKTTFDKIDGIDSITAKGNLFTIRLKEDKDEYREAIVKAAVKSGMGVLEFTPEKVSLEDVFLELTTEEIH